MSLNSKILMIKFPNKSNEDQAVSGIKYKSPV